MARESVPRFDLYGELEVSSKASAEVIEAAYRSLVKRHHPDVARPEDADRIKRLNVAREWLLDPVRRRRYDGWVGAASTKRASTVRTARSATSPPATARSARAARNGGPPPPPPPRPDADGPLTFGPNSAHVRQFLADLRTLDAARAEQLRQGRAAADPTAHGAARRALAAARGQRLGQSLFAREAAALIARGELEGSSVADEIAEIAADIAAAICLRDLVSRAEFELLLSPWTWRGGRITARPDRAATGTKPAADAFATATTGTATATAPSRPSAPAASSSRTDPSRTDPSRFAVSVLAVVIVLAGAGWIVAAINRPPQVPVVVAGGSPGPGPTVAVGAATHAPEPTAAPSPSPIIGPAKLRALQRGAARTIRQLAAAAEAGDVATARDLLGGSAPGLQASGLRRATFSEATATQISMAREAGGWVATTGTDTLRSTDGETWAFDYGDRPLARFGASPEHRLFWLDPRRDVLLRVETVTVTRSEVAVRVAWESGAGGADAAAFEDARLSVASLAIGSRVAPLDPSIDVRMGAHDGTAILRLPGEFRGAARLALVVAVSLPGPAGVTVNETDFELTPG